MADYYPLLSRAIATLPDRDPARRQTIYRRAREVLERQLRSADPPMTEDDILRETLALDDVILRIEADFAELPPPPAPASAPAAPTRPVTAEAELPAAEPDPAEAESEAERNDEPAGEPAMAVQSSRSHEPARPRIASREEHDKNQRKLGFWAVAGVVSIAVMGFFAYVWKEDPALYRRGGVAVAETPAVVETDNAKREGRLASANSEAPSQTSSPRPEIPANPSPPATSPIPAPLPAEPRAPLPVLSRAFMVLETQGAAPNQFEGNANWSFAPDPASRTGEKALRIQVEYPGAGLSIDMALSRNIDAGIQASHTFFVTFNPRDALPAVREMSPIEWRERESQAGPALSGPLVPIQDNVFLMGLDGNEAAVQRNMSLLRFQRWMVFDVRLANSRRAAFLIEKGAMGEKAITEALATWK
jgi:hypothetical protein